MGAPHVLVVLVCLSVILVVSGQYQALASGQNKPSGQLDPSNRQRVKYYQVNPINNRIRTTKLVRRINRLSRQINPDTVVTFANVIKGREEPEINEIQSTTLTPQQQQQQQHQKQESSSAEDAILENDIANESMKVSMTEPASAVISSETTSPSPSPQTIIQEPPSTPSVLLGFYHPQNLPSYGFYPGLQPFPAPYIPVPSYNPVFYPAYLEPDNLVLSPFPTPGLMNHNIYSGFPNIKILESNEEIPTAHATIQVKKAEDGTKDKKPNKQESGQSSSGSGILNSFLTSAASIAGAQVGSQLAGGVFGTPPAYGPNSFRPQGYGGQGFGGLGHANQGPAYHGLNNQGFGNQAYGNQGFQGQRPNNGYGFQGISQFQLANTLGTQGYGNQGFNGQGLGYGGNQGINNQGFVNQGYPGIQGQQGNSHQRPSNQGYSNHGFSNQGNNFGSPHFQGSSFGGSPDQGFSSGFGHSAHQNQDYFRTALPVEPAQTRILPLAPAVANHRPDHQISNLNSNLGNLPFFRTEDLYKYIAQADPVDNQDQPQKAAAAPGLVPVHTGYLVIKFFFVFKVYSYSLKILF